MKKIVLTILQYVIFFGLGGLLIWWQYGKLSPNDKTEIFTSFSEVKDRIWLVLPVLIVGFLSHLFRALRWKLLLEPLKLKPTTANITFAVLIGYLVNLLVPRMGEVARCTVLAKYEREPVDKIVGTIVAERSFDILCLVLVTLLAFVLQMEIASEYVNEQMAKFAISGTAIAVILGGMAGFIALLILIYRRNKKSKIGHFISNIGYGILSIKFMHKKRPVPFIYFSYLVLLSLTCIYWF